MHPDLEFADRLRDLTDDQLDDLQRQLLYDLDAPTHVLAEKLGLIHRERCRRIDERSRHPLPF